MRRAIIPLLFSVPIAICLLLNGCSSDPAVRLPGKLEDGRVLLPNGWLLSPAGAHVPVGELPLNMALTPDEHTLIVTNNGTREQSLSVIDVASWKVTQTIPVAKSWLGLRMYDQGRKFLVSCGNDNRIDLYRLSDGRASRIDSILVGSPWPKEKIWVAGIDVDDSSETAYVAGKESMSLYVVDLRTHRVRVRVELPATPYTCLLSRSRPLLYVSLWGGSAVAVIDRRTNAITATLRVGDHPCDMVETPDGQRLFVANANNNTVSVIDLRSLRVTETISSALSPDAPNGSTPNAIDVNADGSRLYVANADNNFVCVVDISTPGQARSLGFIPTGWYPTCVRAAKLGKELFVASAKGLGSRANPGGPNPERRSPTEDYIGSMFRGVVSRIDTLDSRHLQAYSKSVYANSRAGQAAKSGTRERFGNPIPSVVGGVSPIKYVFYIIRENRTYDQVFGDIKNGNGDPTLCLFPESVTPNAHALAREFVLLDNFYCDAEVSADGHNWSMGAYATDFVEKTWPTQYGGRGGDYVYQGEAAIAFPSSGYLWDACSRAGVTYRTYGEFVDTPERIGDSATTHEAALVGHMAPGYRGWDLSYSDVDRVKAWMKEFDAFEKTDALPRFCSFTLPNDHTAGTQKGNLTPRAFVAQNDLALGMIVERISHSRFWKESAVFVIEDDAQNGPDHVDAHRTVALVISPFCRRGYRDREMYSSSSMVRTIGLILGLAPLSQFDAAATPMETSFTADLDLTPYGLRPATIDIHERNIAGAYGQDRSGRMDFSAPDAVPDADLTEIIWRSIRGADAEVPAPVRSAFVRTVERNGKDD